MTFDDFRLDPPFLKKSPGCLVLGACVSWIKYSQLFGKTTAFGGGRGELASWLGRSQKKEKVCQKSSQHTHVHIPKPLVRIQNHYRLVCQKRCIKQKLRTFGCLYNTDDFIFECKICQSLPVQWLVFFSDNYNDHNIFQNLPQLVWRGWADVHIAHWH